MAMLLRSLRARVIARGARNFRAYADLACAHEDRVWSSNGTANRVLRRPSGPAVIVTPWNAPFMLATWKVAPALAAGCTVVLKPAEWSPLSASLLADLADEAGFPPGVFNVVQGIGEEVGAALVADPRVRRISLTGSPETGRAIAGAAARNLVPFTAELGGKGPFLVFADADLEGGGAEGGRPVRRRRADVPRGHPAPRRGGRRRGVPRAVPPLHRRARARRPAGRCHDDLAADPPRSSRARSRLRRAGTRRRRRGRSRRARVGARRPLVRADPDPAALERERDRPERGFRAGAHAFRRSATRTRRSRSPTPPATASRRSSTRARRSGPSGSEARVRAGTVWVNTFLVRDLTAPFGGIGISRNRPRGRRPRARLLLRPRDPAESTKAPRANVRAHGEELGRVPGRRRGAVRDRRSQGVGSRRVSATRSRAPAARSPSSSPSPRSTPMTRPPGSGSRRRSSAPTSA